jgi:soluble lytic murein transglycosylase-like protein
MLFPNENDYDAIINSVASSYGVDPSLIKATIAQESSFKPDAYREEPTIGDASTGLMQLLNRTAKALGYTGPPEGLKDPATNIGFGVKLISQNIKQAQGNVDVAISAYNAGFSSIRPNDAKRDKDGNIVNQSYVNKVKTYYAYFKGAITSTEVQVAQVQQTVSDNITLIGIAGALIIGAGIWFAIH